MKADLDKKDLSILRVLQKKGRIAISELAEKINLSDTPCLRRIRKLEKTGVITGYGAQLNPKSVGLDVLVYAAVKLTESSDVYAQGFESSILEFNEVIECSIVTGAHDYILKVVSPDLHSYEVFVKKSLGSIKYVSSIESTIVLKQTLMRRELPL